MQTSSIVRRDFLAYSSATVAGLTALRSSLAWAFPARSLRTPMLRLT
jgi:hypothetical protein